MINYVNMFSIKSIIKKFFSKKPDQEISHDRALLKKAHLALRIINHPLRMQILRLLNQHGSMTVAEVHEHLHIEQPVASQELAILRQQGIITAQQNGEKILYAVNYKRIDEIRQISKQL